MSRPWIPMIRLLRKKQTRHEKTLWRFLRDRQLGGLKFRRQHVLGSYIVDFCCIEKGLVVELDGGGHAEEDQEESDRVRDENLRAAG